MYPTDIREFTTQRLVAQIAQALRNETVLELGELYAELSLQPTATTSYHAAAAAVHVLLAHGAEAVVMSESLPTGPRRLADGSGNRTNLPSQVASPGGRGGGGPKDPAGAPAHARRPAKPRAASKPKLARKPYTSRLPEQRCPVCLKAFVRPKVLARHMAKYHAQPSATATVASAA